MSAKGVGHVQCSPSFNITVTAFRNSTEQGKISNQYYLISEEIFRNLRNIYDKFFFIDTDCFIAVNIRATNRSVC